MTSPLQFPSLPSHIANKLAKLHQYPVIIFEVTGLRSCGYKNTPPPLFTNSVVIFSIKLLVKQLLVVVEQGIIFVMLFSFFLLSSLGQACILVFANSN